PSSCGSLSKAEWPPSPVGAVAGNPWRKMRGTLRAVTKKIVEAPSAPRASAPPVSFLTRGFPPETERYAFGSYLPMAWEAGSQILVRVVVPHHLPVGDSLTPNASFTLKEGMQNGLHCAHTHTRGQPNHLLRRMNRGCAALPSCRHSLTRQ